MVLWNPFLALGTYNQLAAIQQQLCELEGIYGLSVGDQFVVIVKPLKLQVAGSTALINDPHLRILRQA